MATRYFGALNFSVCENVDLLEPPKPQKIQSHKRLKKVIFGASPKVTLKATPKVTFDTNSDSKVRAQGGAGGGPLNTHHF